MQYLVYSCGGAGIRSTVGGHGFNHLCLIYVAGLTQLISNEVPLSFTSEIIVNLHKRCSLLIVKCALWIKHGCSGGCKFKSFQLGVIA